ncbi:MAG: Asp-tRNA(Asn)/Glu-tRNA(Gln) amidotransferase subunit GatB [Gammaproteobacteria bacterium]
MTWETVVGLEIHAQLSCASKIFSPAPAAYCDAPNRQVREVDCGMPGALPVLNRAAVALAIRLGLALESEICRVSEFARKHYFYPDLPKGYQISQFEYPLLRGGRLAIPSAGGEKNIGITRAHLEEDAGKLLHDADGGSGADLNRAGAPLLEIVSEPELTGAADAVSYARTMHQLVRWLGICDGNMQEGSFRIDANISVRSAGAPLGVRCEIKNLNSFRFLEQALEYEKARQIEVLESGGEVAQETRLFDSARGLTRAMRDKEDAHDYRYFPDPDLPPLAVAEEWIAEIRAEMPELPRARRARFARDFALPEYVCGVLTSSRDLADYYERTAAAFAADGAPKNAKLCANWICGELSALLNKHDLGAAESRISPAHLAGLLRRLAAGDISAPTAKTVLEKMWDGGETADAIVKREGLEQIGGDELETIAAEVVAAHSAQAQQFRGGKEKLFGFFVGQMMKASGGRANPAKAGEILRRKLSGAGETPE